MSAAELKDAALFVDDKALALYLDVPRSGIVLLQALFELHDGLGTVRTIDASKGFICILTSSGLLNDCTEMLESVKNLIPWRLAPAVSDPLITIRS